MRTVQLDLNLHPAQAAFLNSNSLYRGFVGGRGAGKTWVGATDVALRAKPDRAYLVASPTSIIMGDTTLPTFLERAKAFGIFRSIKLTPYPNVWLHNGAEVRFRTAEDPERLRGPNLSGAWLDEGSLMADAAFKIVIGCLREGGEQGWLSTTFTPQGKDNWTYEQFGTGKADTEIFKAATDENPFNPPEFAGTLARQYTSRYAQQELGGEFLDPAGSVFKREWFKLVGEVPRSAARVRYWDKAGTADGGAYTAGVLIAKDVTGRFYVEDVARAQLSALDREVLIEQAARLDKTRGPVTQVIEQEPGSGGKESAEATVRRLAGLYVKLDKVTGSKEERAQPFAAQAEAGNVFVLARDWTTAFLEELAAFPHGKYADQADAASGAFNHLATMSVGGPRLAVPDEGQGRNYSLPADTFR